MPRPEPTLLYHFTHVSHLPTIISRGMVCDSDVGPSLLAEVGNPRIKAQRRRRRVDVGPGGVVADYAPFYFAPRSPMLYAAVSGGVPEYAGDQDGIVYLVTSVEQVAELGVAMVFTDRNAAILVAEMTADHGALDDLVDWELMQAKYWFNTVEDPERRERRMAECLVHRCLPWEAVIGVATRTRVRHDEVQGLLAAAGSTTTVRVRENWYF